MKGNKVAEQRAEALGRQKANALQTPELLPAQDGLSTVRYRENVVALWHPRGPKVLRSKKGSLSGNIDCAVKWAVKAGIE